MITISSLSQFDFYNNFELIAGKDGLFNSISNVVILEYESMLEDYSGFTEGNLVLTSLFFAKDNPKLVFDAFQHLINKGISGIAIKTAYYKYEEIPQDVIDLANEVQVPLFLFHDVYMEDIIIGVTRLAEWSEHLEYYQEKVHALVSFPDCESECISLIQQINPAFTYYLSALYWEPKLDNIEANRLYNQIIYQKSKLFHGEQIFILKYYDGFIFLFHFEKLYDADYVKKYMQNVINELRLSKISPNIAMCEILHPAKQIKELLMKCFYTDIARRLMNQNECTYNEIGVHQMLLPTLLNPDTKEVYSYQLTLLEAYDDTKTGYLLDTLLAYVDNDMQINATADALFQHPNTVRYRLDKAKELSKLNTFSFSVAVTYIVELYRLNQLNISYLQI